MVDIRSKGCQNGLVPHEDHARIAQAVQALSSAQISELGGVSFDTLVQLVSVVLGSQHSTDSSPDVPLTTNQAASRLGMSRPFLIKLLDQGDIPFHRIGRDRRILLGDVTDYLARRDAEKVRFMQAALSTV
jgi:excisionase family DNA binding protein